MNLTIVCVYIYIYIHIHTYIYTYIQADECNYCLYRALYGHILLNKYDCHIEYVSDTNNMLNGVY